MIVDTFDVDDFLMNKILFDLVKKIKAFSLLFVS